MPTSEGEILRLRIRGTGKSVEEAATAVGLTRRMLYYYFAMEKLPDDIKEKAKEKLNIDIVQIVQEENGGSQNVHNTKKSVEVKAVPFEDFMEVKYLPAYAQAGYLTGYSDNILHDEELDTILVPREFERGNYLVIEVTGPSMDDGTKKAICDGDKILIKELDKSYYAKDRLHYKDVLFVLATKHDGVTVKQITKHDVEAGIVTCHSWNPMFKDFDVKVKNIIRLFYVKKIVERKINF